MLSDMRGQIETPGMDSRCNLIQRTGEDSYLASVRAARSKTSVAKCYIMRTVSVRSGRDRTARLAGAAYQSSLAL
jgi:hypothetical protein